MIAPPGFPTRRPRIAFAIGCPAGVAPELTARMLADPEVTTAAQIIAIGDRRVLDKGARIAGVTLDLLEIAPGAAVPANVDRPVFVDLKNLDPATIPVGALSVPAGKSAIANFKHAISLAANGEADVVAFTPFNKASMRLGHPAYEDEIVFLTEMLDFKGTASEFNVLPTIWNARVTSHVPISGVADLITFENVLRGLRLTDRAMREGGYAAPRIAVAGLNPHAGDGGNFGREEIDVIEPAVVAAQREGIVCHGPLPSDTVFVRARKGEFDAVLTDRAMREGGYAAPRIAVAGLNPHAGDGGNFGREEIDVIEPAVIVARREGIVCHGPLPSDTVFVRARKGEFDAVLTMYHDQGQVAMKLIGFDEGITLLGGFPFPLLTAAHGSAYDIAGKGIANPGAIRAALLLAAKMGARRISAKAAA